MPNRSANSYLALVIHDAAAPSVGRCMSSAAGGVPLTAGPTVAAALATVEGAPRLMVVSHEHLDDAIAALSDFPEMRLAVLTPETTDRLLSKMRKLPQLVGLLAWLPAGVRPWELSYLVRRSVAPDQPSPASSDVLLWGGSSVSWRPSTSEERDRAVRSVELVGTRFGIARRVAAAAADAAHELLMNAMVDAQVDARGRRRFPADRTAAVSLRPEEVPTMQLTVDSSFLALDVMDPFGSLGRNDVIGGILSGRGDPPTDPALASALGFFTLFSSAAILRVEVAEGRHTLVSWMVDRSVSVHDHRNLARSVYFIETPAG